MGLLGSKKKEHKSNKISSATIITACMEITGNLKGTDTIHIDGKVTGDISVENTLVIGKTGLVMGDVKAKNAIINGELQGSILCDELEVMETGKLSKEVQATNLIINGSVEGNIIGLETITILEKGNLKVTGLHSKIIKVNGIVEGKITATELLEIENKGSVKGEISVKNIKTAEGGKMIGSMSTYEVPPKGRKK